MSTTIDISDSSCTAPLHVLNDVLAMHDEINENRRWFHANPELSFQEVKTAAKVGMFYATTALRSAMTATITVTAVTAVHVILSTVYCKIMHFLNSERFPVLLSVAKVVELLKSYGIDEIYEKIGRTGVVAMIHGGHPGPCIGNWA
jgi:metal-dependent amidase/aminoacylase/carboxypeptidase family protein